jgi:hypothetical protein
MAATKELEQEQLTRLKDAVSQVQEKGKAADEAGERDSLAKPSQDFIRSLGQERGIELLLWVLREDNSDVRAKLRNLKDKPEAQLAELQRLAKREDVIGSLNDGDTEDWIDKRRQAKREGKRR